MRQLIFLCHFSCRQFSRLSRTPTSCSRAPDKRVITPAWPGEMALSQTRRPSRPTTCQTPPASSKTSPRFPRSQTVPSSRSTSTDPTSRCAVHADPCKSFCYTWAAAAVYALCEAVLAFFRSGISSLVIQAGYLTCCAHGLKEWWVCCSVLGPVLLKPIDVGIFSPNDSGINTEASARGPGQS